MKKIKLVMAVVGITSLLGITSLAAVTTGINGVNKVENADTVEAINNNADILGAHIDDIATSDALGHIKIGTGLEITEDGTTSAKIANDLETDDSTTALSTAMGAKLNELLSSLQTITDGTFSVASGYSVNDYALEKVNKDVTLSVSLKVTTPTSAWGTTLGTVSFKPTKTAHFAAALQGGESCIGTISTSGVVSIVTSTYPVAANNVIVLNCNYKTND